MVQQPRTEPSISSSRNIQDLSLDQLVEAPWNPNHMADEMLERLRESIRCFGFVENLVVRPIANARYEVLSGNQSLKILQDSGYSSVPCVVLQLDHAHARLLSQALNYIRGEDNLGLRAELLRDVLASLEEDEVLALLPETGESLRAFASLGQEDLASHLQAWQAAQTARLKHLQFQLTQGQLEVIEEVLVRLLPLARQDRESSPNARGTALYLLCKDYLEREDAGL